MTIAIEKTILRRGHYRWPIGAFHLAWGRPVLQFHLGEAGITVNVQPSYGSKCTRLDISIAIAIAT